MSGTDFEYSVHFHGRYRGFESLASSSPITVLITTFLASAVEAIEMVIIVVGVGATRGWRSTWIGTASGFGVLAVIDDEDEAWTGPGIDWTAFALAFKGVTLEGLEIAFVVVAFGAGANQLGVAAIGGAGALVLIGAAGLLLRGVVQRVPRSFLQLIVGVLLTTFGTFWSLEGMGVDWPGSDGAILGLLALYAATAAIYITLERQRAFGLRPAA